MVSRLGLFSSLDPHLRGSVFVGGPFVCRMVLVSYKNGNKGENSLVTRLLQASCPVLASIVDTRSTFGAYER